PPGQDAADHAAGVSPGHGPARRGGGQRGFQGGQLLGGMGHGGAEAGGEKRLFDKNGSFHSKRPCSSRRRAGGSLFYSIRKFALGHEHRVDQAVQVGQVGQAAGGAAVGGGALQALHIVDGLGPGLGHGGVLPFQVHHFLHLAAEG